MNDSEQMSSSIHPLSVMMELSECIETIIDHRGKTPKKLGSDWVNEGIKVISAKNVHNGALTHQDEIRYVTNEVYKKWMKEDVKVGDCLLSSEGATFGESLYWDFNFPVVLGQRIFCIRANPKILDPMYLYVYMKTNGFLGQIEGRSSGTSVFGLKQSELLKVSIPIIPLEEQKRIGLINYNINRKIDLLNRNNKTLEQLAETLFRQWFVEEADDSWSNGKLCDLITIKYGKDHKQLSDGNIPVYGSGGLMRFADKSLYNKESVLIPRKGTLSNIMLVQEPFWTVDTMFYTEMKLDNLAKFIYHFINSQDIASMNVGSAVPSLTTEILNNIELTIPPPSILKKYEEQVSVLYDKKNVNNKTIKNLELIRDTLLPKLMSGTLRVIN